MEFLPGETYYYISVPTPGSPGQCLRLQSLSQPILLGAMERVARQGGKEGPLPVPSVSCCCCCFQFCDS
ncbi:hypothetical protein Celaphus_00001940 [Cervus elaphus hippelaphus]|uniref:Ephrin RBD domain-containing protein n=2 Tax=Cervus TaxID=9859 RepID=A0A212CFI1_CEREH|nr:hypothetical protein Celaphus_00001940 [Cervus elaphus hippelaphus]